MLTIVLLAGVWSRRPCTPREGVDQGKHIVLEDAIICKQIVKNAFEKCIKSFSSKSIRKALGIKHCVNFRMLYIFISRERLIFILFKGNTTGYNVV